jgi:hypothetical protein
VFFISFLGEAVVLGFGAAWFVSFRRFAGFYEARELHAIEVSGGGLADRAEFFGDLVASEPPAL